MNAVRRQQVTRRCEKPLSVGKGIWLYHNTTFQIGDTTFTYIERDL